MNSNEHKQLVVREKIALALVFLCAGVLGGTIFAIIIPPFTVSTLGASLLGLSLVALAYSVYLCILRGVKHAEWHDENDHR